ncbi:MAG: protein disulfide oxidoreductase [bacterium]
MTEKPEQKKNWKPWARDIAIAFIAVMLFQWWQTRDIAAGQAPELSGNLLTGQQITLEDYRGEPVLVHFWAEWCGICRTEEGWIDSLAKDYPVITVATSSGDAAAVQKYLDQRGLSFPVLVDEDGSIGQQWGIRGVPSSFVIDGVGDIQSSAVGFTTGISLRLRMWLAG